MRKAWLPPSLNTTYIGKTGAAVAWRAYRDGDEATAPHLPLSALLPSRRLNTGSVLGTSHFLTANNYM